MRNIHKSLKNLFHQKLISSVIIISMALGFACINLISVFIYRELNTDKFHEHHKEIFVMNTEDIWEPGKRMYYTRSGSAEYLKENYPEVVDFCRNKKINPKRIIANNNNYFGSFKMMAVSSNFFNFFSYHLLTNNPNSVLETKQSFAISEEMASKYFGSLSPVGQLIIIETRKSLDTMVVSGVFRKPEENSQMDFDFLSLIDSNVDSHSFIRLLPGADIKALEKSFVANKEAIPIIHDGTPGSYYLEPLNSSYFANVRRSIVEHNRDMKDLWIAGAIGMIVLIVALFNYFGLLNNRINNNEKEYVIRRINGGSKRDLVSELFKENLLLIFISTILGFLMMILALPYLNQLLNTEITIDYFFDISRFLLILGAIVIIVSAVYLFLLFRVKRSMVISLVKANSNKSRRKQLPVFHVSQMVASIILIIATITILKQMNYISNKPIGLDKDIIEIKVPQKYQSKVKIFKDELNSSTLVDKISISTGSPVLEHWVISVKYEHDGQTIKYFPSGFVGDNNYIETLGIKLLEGNGFSENPATNKDKCLVNQTLADLFPNTQLVGNSMPGKPNTKIIGIVEDFHYSDLKKVVEPAMIVYGEGTHLLVKPAIKDIKQLNTFIAQVWDKLIPDYPLNVESIADRYEFLHRENQNFISLISTFSLISIFLSMIGLFTSSVQNAQSRIKEIGIRKVTGAKVADILSMFNEGFAKWVALAIIIAFPISYYTMNNWLQNFAYKTEFSWWIFALAGFIALFIALVTVSWQSWLAARRNPVEALRYE